MCYRYDQDKLGLDLVNDGEREALEKHAPGAFPFQIGHPKLGGGDDKLDDALDFHKEVLAKTGGLGLIELRGLVEFFPCGREESVRSHRRRRDRASAKTLAPDTAVSPPLR